MCGWAAKTKSGYVLTFHDLNTVAEAIREVGGERLSYRIQFGPFNGGKFRAAFSSCESLPLESFGATEAEALTRALLEYLRANKVGEEHLQPPEPEEPWIDVSESVSTANLPEHNRECELKFDDSVDKRGWPWLSSISSWESPRGSDKPKALGGSVIKWRYAK